MTSYKVARWQNLIPSFPWIALGWRAWGHNPRKGRDKIVHLATLCSLPLKSRATSVPGTGRGAIRHSSAGEFLRNVGILLRDALLLPNGPQLHLIKLTVSQP